MHRLARAVGENQVLQHDRAPFCGNNAIDIEAKGLGVVCYSELTFGLMRFKIFMSAALATWSRRRRRDAEGKFADVETMTNNTLTKAIDQFEQMVIAVEQTFAEGR